MSSQLIKRQKKKSNISTSEKFKLNSKYNSLINELILINPQIFQIQSKRKSSTPNKNYIYHSPSSLYSLKLTKKTNQIPIKYSKTVKPSKPSQSLEIPSKTSNIKYIASKTNSQNFREMNTSPLIRGNSKSKQKKSLIKTSNKHSNTSNASKQKSLMKAKSTSNINDENNAQSIKSPSNTKIPIPSQNKQIESNEPNNQIDPNVLNDKKIMPLHPIQHKIQKSSSVPNILHKTKVYKTIYKIESLSQVGFSGPGVKKYNQDNYFIYKNLNDEQNTLYIGVCDGHGLVGHDVSKYIISHLPQTLNSELKKTNKYINNKDNLFTTLKKVFLSTNRSLCNSYSIDTQFSGSTCVTIILTKNKVISANVGDSRAVLGRYTNDKWVSIDLSRDHKPNDKDESQRILAKGGRIEAYKDENGADFGPKRIWLKDAEVPGLAMSRSFGDEVAASVGAICEPEIKVFELSEDDKFIILASDGIWEFISSQECIEMIKDYYVKKDLTNCLKYLFIESSKRWIKEEGVIDDITAVLIFFEGNENEVGLL